MSTKENLQDAIDYLNQARDSIETAADLVQRVLQLLKEESLGYNITGNIKVYILNYLVDGVDCIDDKLQRSIEQIQERLDEENDPEKSSLDDEDFEDEPE